MSDFSEELTKLAVAEEDPDTSVFCNTGMRFPWLQKHVEAAGKRNNIEAFHLTA